MGSAAAVVSQVVTSAGESELKSIADGLTQASKEKLIVVLTCDVAQESKGETKTKEEQEDRNEESTQAEETNRRASAGNKGAPDGTLVQDSKQKTKREEAEEDAANQRHWSNQSIEETPRHCKRFRTSLMLDFRGNKVVLENNNSAWEDESDGEGCLVTRQGFEFLTYTGTWYEARNLVITCQHVSSFVECTTIGGNCIANLEVPPEQRTANGLQMEAYGEWLAERLSELLGRDPGLRLVLTTESGKIFWSESTEGQISSAEEIVLLLTTVHSCSDLCGPRVSSEEQFQNGFMSRVALRGDDAVMSPFIDPVKKMGGPHMHFSELRREPKT